MFNHITVGADDIAAAKRFYDAIFATFGGPEGTIDDKGRLFYWHDDAAFIVLKPIDGQPATHANGGTIGFRMMPEQIDAWWKAGQESGGTACEDPPGFREGRPYYLAYLRDPAGNKLCAVHRPA